ncbi:hypothetical protein HUJ05_007735 [Dendroctonus ponderosae]|nr:hypothetical protein HUJ05_007735 [Dendroctonus ponderosae]
MKKSLKTGEKENLQTFTSKTPRNNGMKPGVSQNFGDLQIATVLPACQGCTRTKRKMSNSKCICASQASGAKRPEWEPPSPSHKKLSLQKFYMSQNAARSTDHTTNQELLHRINKNQTILETIKKRKTACLGNVLRQDV